MSMKLMTRAFDIKVGSHLRKLILIKLADNANDQGECWPSYGYIANQCECSKSAVKEHISALISMGLVGKENRLGGAGGQGNKSNIYHLNFDNQIYTPMPADNPPPVSSAGTPVPPKSTPVPSGNPPPVPPAGTRISHSFESVIEPINEPKELGASGDEPSAKKIKNAYSEEFEKAWKGYPAREGSNPKNSAYGAWNARVREGVDPDVLLAGVIRYAAFCQAKGQTGTTYVMQGQRFFGKSREFENTWAVSSQPLRAGRIDTHSGFDSRDYGDSQINF